MKRRKYTTGYVMQVFDEDGRCVEQEFVADSMTQWTDMDGGPSDPPEAWYHPFEMVEVPTDRFKVGDWVLIPEPVKPADAWNHSFVGFIEHFRYCNLATVIDAEDNAFDVETDRLTPAEDPDEERFG